MSNDLTSVVGPTVLIQRPFLLLKVYRKQHSLLSAVSCACWFLVTAAWGCAEKREMGAPNDTFGMGTDAVEFTTAVLTGNLKPATPSWGRQLADVTGDGKADLVWRYGRAIRVARSNGAGFDRAQTWSAYDPRSSFLLANVDGRRGADLVGRYEAGDIQVALSSGTGFDQPSSSWTSWDTNSDYQLADMTGEGKADLVGRNGTDIQTAESTGSSFARQPGSLTFWGADYDYKFADVTGDGRADLIGRYDTDIQIAVSTGSGVEQPSRPLTPWDTHYDYQLADVTGDGKADLVGRYGTDIQVAASTGTSVEETSSQWTTWSELYDHRFADVTGLDPEDNRSRADIVGRSLYDVQVGRSIVGSERFANSTRWAGGDDIYSGYVTQVSQSLLDAELRYMCTSFPLRQRKCCNGNLESSADYIERKFKSWGYSVARESVEVVGNPLEFDSELVDVYCTKTREPNVWDCGQNIVATKLGSDDPNSYIEFTGHYDNVFAGCGAKDNLTAVVSVLEMARVLASYPNKHSMRFVAFAAEEVATNGPGSRVHVRKAMDAGENVIAALNQDLTGTSTSWKPSTLVTVLYGRDKASVELAQQFAAVVQAIGAPLDVYVEEPPIDQSDERPYFNAHVPALTTWGYLPESLYHTAGDVYANVNFEHVLWVTKVNLALGIALDEGSEF